MTKTRNQRAFTLIELLVVVAIIALLLSILLPSLSTAREQGKKAKCLANLNNLGKAMYQYANEDRAEQIIPVHQNMILPNGEQLDYELWKTANWFCWGGRSAQRPMMTTRTRGFFLSDDEDQHAVWGNAGMMREEYAAHRRPLNIYMVGDIGIGDEKQLEWYRCPSDVGYPDHPLIDDIRGNAKGKPCYDILGNSYRGSLFCYADVAGTGITPAGSWFAMGPWGHRLTTIVETGRTVLAGEPTYFNMIGQDSGGDAEEVLVYGWHKRKMMDNLLFCDGSARTTKAEAETRVQSQDADSMNLYSNDVLARYGNVKLDVYPTPGARIGYYDVPNSDQWPFKNYQDNFVLP